MAKENHYDIKNLIPFIGTIPEALIPEDLNKDVNGDIASDFKNDYNKRILKQIENIMEMSNDNEFLKSLNIIENKFNMSEREYVNKIDIITEHLNISKKNVKELTLQEKLKIR